MNNKSTIDYSDIKSLPDLLCLMREKDIPDNQFWKYISVYQDRKAREKGIPLNGQFELTPLCNLDCKMCYVHLNSNQLNSAKLLPGEWWKDIASQAHSLGMMNAVLTGGECLTYPEFDQVYMYLRSLGVSVSIKTNGVLLNKERIAFFKKHSPRNITISLYGSTNEAYENVTGRAAFDIVYDNLLQLKNVDFPVIIAITPSKYLLEDIENVIDLVRKLNIPFTVNALLIQPRIETGRVVKDLTPREYAKIFKLIKEKKSSDTGSSIENDLTECVKDNTPKMGINCGAGRSSFCVSWNGNMSGCNNLNSLEINLLDRDFSTAWELIHLDALSYPLPAECNKCAYSKACLNCVAYRSTPNEKGHCNPEICERTKIFVNEGIYQI